MMSRIGIGGVSGRSGQGRTNSFSDRALKNKLEVVIYECPFCGHHKALQSLNFKKCARCKRRFDEQNGRGKRK